MSWLLDTLVWTGALIALVLVLRRPVCRWFGPQVAYALWALPFARLFLPPIELPASWAPVADPAQAPEAATYTVTSMAVPVAEVGVSAPGLPWLEIAVALWLTGALAFVAHRTRSYRQMRDMVLADAVPVGEDRDVRLVETDAIDSPVAFGLFDKVVALPEGFLLMPDRTARDLAIAHELAHHRAHDILANFAAQPLFALHWFNPLGWLGWRALRRDQEAACDARVAHDCDRAQRAKYAATIAGFAAAPESALPPNLASAMACPILGEKSIIYRLRSLSMYDTTTRRSRSGKLLLAGAALALPLTASISYAAEEVLPDAAPAPRAIAAEQAAPDVQQDSAEQERKIRVIVRDSEDAEAVADGVASVIRLEDREEFSFFTDGKELSEEEMRAKLEELAERDARLAFFKDGDEGRRIMIRRFETESEVDDFMIRIEEGCDGEDNEIVTERKDGDVTVLRICKIAALKIADEALSAASFGLKEALREIERDEDLSADEREEARREIRRAIAEIEAERS